MKKILTIKGIFNDVFTNYKNKEDSVSMIVDDELDCTCNNEEINAKCIIHDLTVNHTLSDIIEK